jgi:hypothetical protein
MERFLNNKYNISLNMNSKADQFPLISEGYVTAQNSGGDYEK